MKFIVVMSLIVSLYYNLTSIPKVNYTANNPWSYTLIAVK
jgi:hypothetical protein